MASTTVRGVKIGYLYYEYRLQHHGVPPSDLQYIEQQRKALLEAPGNGF